MTGVWQVFVWQREGKRQWSGQPVTLEMKEIPEFSPTRPVFSLGQAP
jgi:hypothetical protein